MKKSIYMMFIILGLVAVLCAPTPTTAAGDSSTVAGAARATFANGAALGSVALSSLDLGTGVFFEPGGSATGVFSAVLTGRSLLGQAQQITIDGQVLRGALAPNGQASFSGTATVNFGDGRPSLSAVPFSVSATTNSVRLAIDSTTLPAARVATGNIVIN